MQITRQQLIGLMGSVLLLIGVFVPVVTIPLMGDLDFFEIRNFNGLIDYSFTGIAYGIVGLGLASVLLALLNYCRGLLISGLLALGIFGLTIKQLLDIEKNLHDNLTTNFLMNITGTTVDSNNLRWGWVVLLTGALVLIVASFLKSKARQGLQ